jgi:hypothetical protein
VRAKEAAAAIEQVLKLDPSQKMFAAWVDTLLQDPAAVRRHLEGEEGELADFRRTYSYALEGNAAEAARVAGARAGDGSRRGEDLLLAVLAARLQGRLGSKAPAFWKAAAAARDKVNAAGPPSAAVPEEEKPRTVKNVGYMQRYVTYRPSLCGGNFAPRGVQPHFALVGGKPHVGWAIVGQAECEPDAQRLFPFNLQPVEGGQVTISLPNDGWEEAEAAFVEGCGALLKEDYPAAATAFAKVLEKEDAFTRAKVFAALAKALGPSPDLAGAAAQAKVATTELPEDLLGREVTALLRFLAGEDVASELEDIVRTSASLQLRQLSRL